MLSMSKISHKIQYDLLLSWKFLQITIPFVVSHDHSRPLAVVIIVIMIVAFFSICLLFYFLELFNGR